MSVSPEAYLEPIEISTMQLLAKKLIVDVRLGSKYASEIYWKPEKETQKFFVQTQRIFCTFKVKSKTN